MNKRFLWFMVLLLALPLLFTAQPIGQAAEGWTSWSNLGGSTNTAPTIYNIGNKLVVVAPGKESVFLRWTKEGGWSDWCDTKIYGVDATIGSYGNTAYLITRSKANKLFFSMQTDVGAFASKTYPTMEIRDAYAASAPSAVTFGNKVYVFFRGTNNHIYFVSGKQPAKNLTEVPGGGLTTSEPRAAVVNNQIWLAVRGTDDCIYLNIMSDSGTWRGWRQVPGNGRTLSGPAIGYANGTVYFMVRGTDNGIYVNSIRNGDWSVWKNIGGQTTSGPCLASFGNVLYAVVRGTDNRIYLCYLQGRARNDDEHDNDGRNGHHDGQDGDKHDRHDGQDGDRRDGRDGDRHDGQDGDRGKDRHDGDQVRDEDRPSDSKFIENNIPDTMKAGESYNVNITIKNTGEAVWFIKNNYQLGCTGDFKFFGLSRLSLNTDRVKRDDKITFTFTLTAPNEPGEYNITWQMSKNNSDWFGDKLTKTIKVRRDRKDGHGGRDEDRRDDDHQGGRHHDN